MLTQNVDYLYVRQVKIPGLRGISTFLVALYCFFFFFFILACALRPIILQVYIATDLRLAF